MQWVNTNLLHHIIFLLRPFAIHFNRDPVSEMSITYLPPEMYQKLFERSTPTPLRPKSSYFPELTPQISNLKLAGKSAPPQVLTTLHLLNDDIKSAHDIAEPFYYQGEHTCDYQHGIVHIRDGDYGNAMWWFGQLSHPLLAKNFAQSKEENLPMNKARQRARNFIAECERVGTGTSDDQRLEEKLYHQLKSLADWTIREFVEGK
ncbi:unnamed protein product [Rhizoctonia solani]|uniref:Uncharacterized protein n=1 Tax=Rhizoctonia solani TaxID=456999 RepID=A0A8H2W6U8_9AGAM|nr:unnamed protein product [Rhizoctonia solani]